MLDQDLAADAVLGEWLSWIRIRLRFALILLLRAALIYWVAQSLLELTPALASQSKIPILTAVLSVTNLTKWASVFAIVALLAVVILAPLQGAIG